MPARTIAFATCRPMPDMATDDQLVLAYLPPNVAVVPAAWDDPAMDWDAFDLIVLRSCWNYHRAPAAFLAWVAERGRSDVPLSNAASLVAWNADKHYLRDLASGGIPIVPTAWLQAGAHVDLAALLAERGWDEAVVKPTVSAGADGTWRTSRRRAGQDQVRLEDLLRRRAAMVQPFLPQVATEGEWSFVFIDGAYSHAVLKQPKAGDFRVQYDFGGTARRAAPPASLVAQAQRVMDAAGTTPLYARVDGVVRGGTLCLMELELVEPVLFLGLDSNAPRRFADALSRRLQASLADHPIGLRVPAAPAARSLLRCGPTTCSRS